MIQHPHHSPALKTQYDPQHPYVPLKMFLTFPASQDDYYKGEGSNFRRFIFEATAKQTYTNQERKKYKQFMQFWQQNKNKIPANVINNSFWNQQWRFRWLTSEQFNIKNTLKAMEKYSDYLLTNRFNVTPRAQKLLKQGIFYVCGRDAYLRPILVFDVDKMMSMDMTEQDVIQTQKFFFEKVLNYYLLPGQVETWVAIIDVNYRNLMSLISPLRSSIGFLSDTFRNRMRICYIVRIPASLGFLWKICKGFMHEQTAQKINFLDDQQVKPLLAYCNPSQVQKKYGGTQPEIFQFWPPKTVQQLQKQNLLNFQHPDIISTPISPQAYRVKHQKGKLEGHKISKMLLKKQQQKEVAKITQRANAVNNQNQAPTAILSSTNNFSNTNSSNLKKTQIPSQMINSVNWPVQAKPMKPQKATQQNNIQWDRILI